MHITSQSSGRGPTIACGFGIILVGAIAHPHAVTTPQTQNSKTFIVVPPPIDFFVWLWRSRRKGDKS